MPHSMQWCCNCFKITKTKWQYLFRAATERVVIAILRAVVDLGLASGASPGSTEHRAMRAVCGYLLYRRLEADDHRLGLNSFDSCCEARPLFLDDGQTGSNSYNQATALKTLQRNRDFSPFDSLPVHFSRCSVDRPGTGTH